MGEDLERLQLEPHEIELCRSYINVRAQIKQARQHVKGECQLWTVAVRDRHQGSVSW